MVRAMPRWTDVGIVAGPADPVTPSDPPPHDEITGQPARMPIPWARLHMNEHGEEVAHMIVETTRRDGNEFGCRRELSTYRLSPKHSPVRGMFRGRATREAPTPIG
nr:hypothetical protein ISGA_1527 [Gordonia sp. NB41Y]